MEPQRPARPGRRRDLPGRDRARARTRADAAAADPRRRRAGRRRRGHRARRLARRAAPDHRQLVARRALRRRAAPDFAAAARRGRAGDARAACSGPRPAALTRPATEADASRDWTRGLRRAAPHRAAARRSGRCCGSDARAFVRRTLRAAVLARCSAAAGALADADRRRAAARRWCVSPRCAAVCGVALLRLPPGWAAQRGDAGRCCAGRRWRSAPPRCCSAGAWPRPGSPVLGLCVSVVCARPARLGAAGTLLARWPLLVVLAWPAAAPSGRRRCRAAAAAAAASARCCCSSASASPAGC